MGPAEYTFGHLKRDVLPLTITAIAVAVSRLLSLPRTFWEGEEVRFALALLTFDPYRLQPDAPGYPLYVGLGRLVNVFLRDPLLSLVTLSVVASIAGSVVLALAAGRILGDIWLGVAASLIFYCSPAMLVFSPLPNAEAVAAALLACALLCRDRPVLLAVFAAAAIGARPQMAPAVLVLLVPLRSLRAWLACSGVLLACFFPLAEWIGFSRIDDYVRANLHIGFERDLVLRFTAHPWGSKLLSFPLLAIAGIGFFVRRLWPLAAFAAIHTAVCLLTASRFEGVQPVIPALLPIAIFAAAAFTRWPKVAVAAAVVYSIGAWTYSAPILQSRRTSGAPAVSAAVAAGERRVLVDPTFEPFADYFNLNAAPIKAFGVYDDVLLMVQGRSSAPGARVFEWPDSDVYGKVTQELYRVVSLVPVPPERRYLPRLGVYPFESAPERGEWQWLARDAVIDLPDNRATRVTLALPADAPIERNDVTINGRAVTVARGASAGLDVEAAARLVIRSARSYAGPDGRDLAVELIRIERR